MWDFFCNNTGKIAIGCGIGCAAAFGVVGGVTVLSIGLSVNVVNALTKLEYVSGVLSAISGILYVGQRNPPHNFINSPNNSVVNNVPEETTNNEPLEQLTGTSLKSLNYINENIKFLLNKQTEQEVINKEVSSNQSRLEENRSVDTMASEQAYKDLGDKLDNHINNEHRMFFQKTEPSANQDNMDNPTQPNIRRRGINSALNI